MPQLSMKWKVFLSSVVIPIAVVIASDLGLPVVSLLTLSLVFYLPGHILLKGLRPDAQTDFEHLLLAFGLSVAIIIGVGFLLHPVGALRPLGWAAFFAALAAMAWAKKPGMFREYASKVVVAPKASIREAILLSVAALMVVFALILDYHAAAKHADFRFTEFWMTPQRAPNVLTIGIKNSEGEPTTYEVEATSGGLIVGRWLGISLKPGETWTEVFSTAYKPN